MSEALDATEKLPLIWFLVIFPCLVLGVFGWLVSRHHQKLYSPSDYREDQSFVKVAEAGYYAAAASLGAATATRFPTGASSGGMAPPIRRTAEVVAAASRAQSSGKWINKTILWVDDEPGGNELERQSLEEIGFRFVLALSTDEALNKVQDEEFGVIITDMGRPDDQRAGYTLLASLRRQGVRTPLIVYSSSREPEHVAEAREQGAFGATNRPDDLFELVIAATLGEPR